MEQHMGYSSFHTVLLCFLYLQGVTGCEHLPRRSADCWDFRFTTTPLRVTAWGRGQMYPRWKTHKVRKAKKTTGWKFHIWMFPKIVGEIPPNHPWINRVFHYKSSILGETPLFLETPIYSVWGWILSWHFTLAFRDQQSLFDTTQEPTKRGLQIQIGQLLQQQHHTHRITNLMVQYLHSITWKSSLCHFVIVYQ